MLNTLMIVSTVAKSRCIRHGILQAEYIKTPELHLFIEYLCDEIVNKLGKKGQPKNEFKFEEGVTVYLFEDK